MGVEQALDFALLQGLPLIVRFFVHEAREVEFGVCAGCDWGGAAGGVVLGLDEVIEQGLLLDGGG